MEEGLSIIVPLYNEEESLSDGIYSLENTLKQVTSVRRYQIIMVDDGSKDSSFRIGTVLSDKKAEINIVRHVGNCGIGKAGKTGLSRAKYDVVGFVPVDTKLEATDLESIMKSMDNSDVVVCQRKETKDYLFYRRVISLLYKCFLRVLFGIKVGDASWIYFCRTNIFKNITIQSNSGFAAPEILIKSRLKGLRVSMVNIAYHPRRKGRSKSNGLGPALGIFSDMLRVRLSL